MDVYGESGKRAHGTGFVGVNADTEDVVDNLEVYEALVNPQESRPGGNKNNGGMMPPMMMGGAGGGNAAASSGMGNAAAASTAGAVARGVPAGGVVGAPVAAPVASTGAGTVAAGTSSAGAGLGAGTGAGAGAGGSGIGAGMGSGMPSGVVAAEIGDSGTEPAVPTGHIDAEAPGQPGVPEETGAPGQGEGTNRTEPRTSPGGPIDEGAPEDRPGVGPDGRVPVTNDVVSVDPVEIDRVAREWSNLADGMAGLSTNISNLQPAEGDFGMVRVPEPSYGAMTSGLHRMAGGASEEFGQISAGLSATTRSFQETEAEAEATMRGVAQ